LDKLYTGFSLSFCGYLFDGGLGTWSIYLNSYGNSTASHVYLLVIFVIFILMSGLFTAIENMPSWAQQITLVNPIRYFIEVMRMVLLKGAGLF
jgi:ABC-2 type transport system permease protein